MSVRVIQGDCRDVLKTLPDESVHCVVTSPPYFGLRNYQVAGQIGLEPTPSAYVAEIVAVFREVRRVLRKDGTCWLNLGDSYARNGGEPGGGNREMLHMEGRQKRMGSIPDATGLKPKDLIGIPWSVAFALRADGWWLRQDIIWSKPNPMPESVTDRCTKAHEYLFLLTKAEWYYFDATAIAEPSCKGDAGSEFDKGKTAEHLQGCMATGERPQSRRARELAEAAGLTDAHIAAIRSVGVTDAGKAQTTQSGFGKNTDEVIRLASEAKAALGGYYREFLISTSRNKRSVWRVATQPFSEAHFATFPPALIEPCILAGCPAKCCAKCGAPWVREVERIDKGPGPYDRYQDKAGSPVTGGTKGSTLGCGGKFVANRETLGFSPSCYCDADTAPGTVLDPFFGAGTTGLVADRLQRNCIGIELNESYAQMAHRRIDGDAPLFAEAAE